MFLYPSAQGFKTPLPRTALAIAQHGADTQVIDGPTGNAYAIALHDEKGKPLSNMVLDEAIERFIAHVRQTSPETIDIFPVGSLKCCCGNCAHREFRSPAPASRQIVGQCAFEHDGLWFGAGFVCQSGHHAFTLTPKTPTPSTSTRSAQPANSSPLGDAVL